MSGFLIDTNACVCFLRGLFDMRVKFEQAGLENLNISEITLAELLFGVERSANPDKNRAKLEILLINTRIIGIREALDHFAKEKARLTAAGKPIDDFDLLIGCTAVVNGMILVTNNRKHFDRLKGIKLEDWTK